MTAVLAPGVESSALQALRALIQVVSIHWTISDAPIVTEYGKIR